MRKLFGIFSFLLIVGCLHAGSLKRSFAIVIDERCSKEAYTELEAYSTAIEKYNQLKVHLIVDQWGVPDSIRNVLRDLYKNEEAPLCGAVFIGDIPIPMIRDAQHMTSAFKMDQSIDRQESSVPSDRFYDDFDLKFDSEGHDEGTLYHYYSLRPDCTQHLAPELFTGRIRPTDTPESNRFEKLRDYLKKAVRAKQEVNQLDQIFYFTGNGSLNESRVVAIDEKAHYYEHFPWLTAPHQCISYIDHSQHPSVKGMLMNELMRPELDFAVLHHHGSPSTQYLNSVTLPKTIEEAKELIRYRLSDKIRREKIDSNRDSLITLVSKKYSVPRNWLQNVFQKETLVKDSLKEAALNLHLQDFQDYGYTPASRFVILDACYNASFHLDNCIANAYIFSPGETVVVIGGTVNLLQDKWYDRFAGLLGLGMYAGYFNLFQNYLESHLVGDPTFTFTPAVATKMNLNEDIASVLHREGKKLHRKDYHGGADLQAVYLELMFRQGKITTNALLDMIRTSPYSQVRLEALYLLSLKKGDAMVQGIQIAAFDRSEMVQRFAVNLIRSNGDKRLSAPLISLVLQNGTSQRVAFNVAQALMYFSKDVLTKEFNRQFPMHKYVHADKVKKEKTDLINYSANRWGKEVSRLFEPGLKDGTFNFIASCMRLYCPHDYVPDLIRYVRTAKESNRQIKILEALGWMDKSYQAPLIAEAALAMSKDSSLPLSVRNEALKTYNRVK